MINAGWGTVIVTCLDILTVLIKEYQKRQEEERKQREEAEKQKKKKSRFKRN